MAKKDFIKILLLVVPCQIAARVLTGTRQARLSLAEPEVTSYYNTDIDGHPGTYAFGYNVADWSGGNSQFRNEQRYPNGTVVGDYGYRDANGRPHHYRYIADERGYRVMRDRPRMYSPPAITNPSANYQEGNEITWTRKKPNTALKNKKMPYPGKYIIY
ncbi:uncharacterized protein [Choristoneura fumiferana]|uniref:uncharacterized protein n=1 Tax=Choristoneura fumiferana TaxID=7141 RepID=UPI003D15A44C